MWQILRRLRDCDGGATPFENGLLVLLLVMSTATLLAQVEGTVRDVFHNTAVQADTDRELRRR